MLCPSFLVFATIAGLAPSGRPANLETQSAISADRMVFIPNRGQWNPDVKFLAKGENINLWVTAKGLTYDFYRIDGSKKTPAYKRHVVKVSFRGSRGAPQVTGLLKEAGELNYMIGPDQSKWATHVPVFSAAKISNLYKGIDLVTYFDKAKGLPRYDLVVHPGANPRQIAMRYEGASDLRLSDRGTVMFDTSLGKVRERDLVAYQGEENLAGKPGAKDNRVACSQTIRKNGDVAFCLSEYDAKQTLVLDPLIWSTFLGGTHGSAAIAVSLPANGAVYVAGNTMSTDFPTTAGAFQPTSPSLGMFGSNVFFARLSATTNHILSSTYIGGSGSQTATGMAVDPQGNAYITGTTDSSDFPVTANAFQGTKPSPGVSSFVVKISSNGAVEKYGTYLGGTDDDMTTGIAVDSTGAAYVTGNAKSANFPTTPGALQSTNLSASGSSTFIAKLNPAGTQEAYGTYLGETCATFARAIAVDSFGSAYVTGTASDANFPTTVGSVQSTFGGVYDVFLTKLNPAGTSITYSTYLGGTDNDQAKSVAVDSTGAAYLAGSTFSSDFPTTPSSYQPGFVSFGTAPFVTKVSPDGASFVYSTFVGNGASVSNLTVDGSGKAYIVGAASSHSFPTTPGAFQPSTSSDGAVFVSSLSADGSTLDYSTLMGGSFYDLGNAIAVDNAGTIYISGQSGSPNFPTTPDAARPYKPSVQGFDSFVAKLDPTPGIQLSVIRNLLPGGVAIPGNVTLVAPAGPGGVTVQLKSSSNLAKVSTGSLFIAEGDSMGFFNVTTNGVDVTTPVILSATLGNDRSVRTLALTPSAVSTVTLNPTSVWGGYPITVNGKIYLNGKAGPSGLDVELSSSDPSVTFPTTTIKVPPFANTASFTVNHSLVQTDVNALIFANPGGGGLGQLAIYAIKPDKLHFTPNHVLGGQDTIGKIALNHAAPVGGLPVNISFGSSTASVSNSTVVVPAGASSASFTIHTTPVAADENVVVTAVGNGTTITSSLLVTTYKVASVSLTPKTVVGGDGTPVSFTVTLNAPAPPGGLNVALSSSSPAAAIQAVGVFAAGEISHDFVVTHKPVAIQKAPVLKATLNASSQSTTLIVKP